MKIIVGLFILFHLSTFAQNNNCSIDVSFTQDQKLHVKVKLKKHEMLRSHELLSYDKARNILAIFLYNDQGISRTPLLGDYSIHHNQLCFESLSALSEGLRFEVHRYVEFDTISRRIVVPVNPHAANSTVQHVFPISDSLPSNILFFTICFSQPMQTDSKAFTKVKIFDAQGSEKVFPWVHKAEWIDDTTLFLMIHPGRVKRGIKSLAHLGTLFESQQTYTLVVDSLLKDAYGKNLMNTYSKKFKVLSSDYESPKIDSTAFAFPSKNSRDGLLLRFNEGMDYLSVLQGIKVFENDSMSVEGSIQNLGNDREWIFIPKKKWRATKYHLVLRERVSDFASNHLHRKFEISSLSEVNIENANKIIPFVCK